MEDPKTAKYDKQFVSDNLMESNALKIAEELTMNLDLQPGMRVLDLGCGKGLTSIFLAKEFGVEVFATDLWISATENHNRFKQLGLENQISQFMPTPTTYPMPTNTLMPPSALTPTITLVKTKPS